MAMALEIMRGGISAGAAHAILGARNTAVSAAGTTQGTATVLGASINYVTTVGANSGVVLPNASHADSFLIYNAGANPLTIYPPTSGRIYPAATNAGITLTNPGCIMLTKITDTIWVGNLSA